MSTHLPSASLVTLQHRSQLLSGLRSFFVDRGYWECETPVLSNEIVLDANLDPFTTTDVCGRTLYLQTSPEAGMKRLLAAGAEAIFQVSRVMRNGERGRLHNPEFTMIEWYRCGDTHHDQMVFVEQLVRHVIGVGRQLQRSTDVVPQCRQTPPERSAENSPPIGDGAFERLTYDSAFARFAGTGVLHLADQDLHALARDRQISVPPGLEPDDRDGWLNILLAELVEPHLGRSGPQFLHDYPASQAALARIRDEVHPVAERFELYIDGIELCNGYHELTDPDELFRRADLEQANRVARGAAALPGTPLLCEAMRQGLPDSCGVALGFDRLVMIALNAQSIDDVIAFPIERA